ncbi:MAG: hypothetical protein GEEBNDBF_01576 [bacterium]|nr:hypothetical protein [bacterium]
MLAAGAALGYLTLLDWFGIWFHVPWQRYPFMLIGAVLVWAAYRGIASDPHISRPTQQGLWWGLLGFAGGYALQVVYLWNRAGAMLPRSILPETPQLQLYGKALLGADEATVVRMTASGLTSEARWASLLLVITLVLLLLILARAGAWHLDVALRRAADPDTASRRTHFLQQQRWTLLWVMLLVGGVTLLLGCDPRPMDFAEGLALSWAQQHGAIFGFLAGYSIASRRRPPIAPTPRRTRQPIPHPVRTPGLPGRSALV